MPVLAIGREVDGITRPLQRRLELRTQRGFVLDNQNPHSGAFPLRNRTRAAACFDCVSSPNVHRKISLRRNGRLLELSGFAADDTARAGIDIDDDDLAAVPESRRSEEDNSEIQSLMRNS